MKVIIEGFAGKVGVFPAILLCFFLSISITFITIVINVLTLLYLLGLHSYPAKHCVYCRYRYIIEHAVLTMNAASIERKYFYLAAIQHH